jgi:hypothetical protein
LPLNRKWPANFPTMPKRTLFLISANKSRVGSLQWDPDDYDVHDGSADGPVIGRIYKRPFRLPARPGSAASCCFRPCPPIAGGGNARGRDGGTEGAMDSTARLGAPVDQAWGTLSPSVTEVVQKIGSAVQKIAVA